MAKLLFVPLLVVAASLVSAAEWRQFRGNDQTSVADAASPPIVWEDKDGQTKNVAWKMPLPGRGVSSPIVVDGKVIVTASSGFNQDGLHVVCFDTATGSLDWERTFWATGRTLCHPTSAIAAPTPASDGKRIYAFYSSNDLACLDLDGNLLWYRGLTFDYPTAANDIGMAASPLALDGMVVVQVENKGDSFAAALDADTGETLWRVPRTAEMNWTSPTPMRNANGQLAVLLQSSDKLTAHDAKTGEELWAFAGTCDTIPSPLPCDGLVLLPSSGLKALAPPSSAGAPTEVWQENQLALGNASPVVHEGKVYTVNRTGAMACGDAATGKVLWRVRLNGTFWATPVLAAGHLYCVNQDGVAQVVSIAGDKGEIVAENTMGEAILGSPAAADGALYFRSDAHLWKIAAE